MCRYVFALWALCWFCIMGACCAVVLYRTGAVACEVAWKDPPFVKSVILVTM